VLERLHAFLGGGGLLVGVGEHRVDEHHVRACFARQRGLLCQPVDGVGVHQRHARGDVGGGRIARGALQRVGQQRGGDGGALQHGDVAAQRGQHEAVAAEAGGGVHHPRQVLGAFQPHRLGHRLAAAAALFAAVTGGALDELRVHRAVLAAGDQLQPLGPQLQPVAVRRPLRDQRQGKAAGQLPGGVAARALGAVQGSGVHAASFVDAATIRDRGGGSKRFAFLDAM